MARVIATGPAPQGNHAGFYPAQPFLLTRAVQTGISLGNRCPAPGSPLFVEFVGTGSTGVDDETVLEGLDHALAN